MLMKGESRKEPAEHCTKFIQRTDGNLNPYILDVQKLYYQKYSDRRIAEELGVSRYFVYTWRQINGLDSNGESQRGRPRKE